ncbi:unnamed protein product [Blepharisma stoltei]|uniref:ENTH domain-containing protein n=1 Tax=Blepharisma stoltei TaxID=1481888 RepID=A0AAU9JG42_9CILI|nr:unnamed protein product [Blepharisma stoltei]
MLKKAFTSISDKLTLTPTERLLKEAINDEEAGVPSSTLYKIAELTSQPFEYPIVMRHIWDSLKSSNKQWRKILKTFQAMEILLKFGSSRCVQELRDRLEELRRFTQFYAVDKEGNRVTQVSEKARELTNILSDFSLIETERENARKQRGKFVGISSEEFKGKKSSTGGSGRNENYMWNARREENKIIREKESSGGSSFAPGIRNDETRTENERNQESSTRLSQTQPSVIGQSNPPVSHPNPPRVHQQPQTSIHPPQVNQPTQIAQPPQVTRPIYTNPPAAINKPAQKAFVPDFPQAPVEVSNPYMQRPQEAIQVQNSPQQFPQPPLSSPQYQQYPATNINPPQSYSQPQSYPSQTQSYPSQPQSYPSQPQSYPSQPQSYPLQPQSYPPQPQSYPPQPQSYPPQPQSYPPQPQSYPPQSQPYQPNIPQNQYSQSSNSPMPQYNPSIQSPYQPYYSPPTNQPPPIYSSPQLPYNNQPNYGYNQPPQQSRIVKHNMDGQINIPDVQFNQNTKKIDPQQAITTPVDLNSLINLDNLDSK